jgi:catecholate siderophore receptor
MRIIVFATLSLALFTPAAGAQQADTARQKAPQSLPGMNVVDSSARAGYLRLRTGTATRTPTLLRDIPQALTPVSKELIGDLRMQGMADVVRFTPGVAMAQGEGHRDQPSIRGQNTTADFFIDGVRDDAQYFRDLYNVDRVESVRGSNAMIFGRGGGGGILNRVMKAAEWRSLREVSLEGGDHDHKRGAVDLGGFWGPAAARLNGMYQNSGMFREGVRLRRYGVNPTARLLLGTSTVVSATYEYFDDNRTVDRGIPSFQGGPSPAPISVFFGQRDSSYATTRVNSGAVVIDQSIGDRLTIRNHTRLASYDKFYQNVFAGPVDATGQNVTLSGYNNGTIRHNLFNQTDATLTVGRGAVRHTILAGVELGRQHSDNLRNTAYFNDATATTTASFDSPTVTTMVRFRPSATDANNRVTARTGSVYLQEQMEVTRYLQLVGGVRLEQFAMDFHNNRDSSNLSRRDRMWSPRGGVVLKPAAMLSLYGTLSVSHLPASGDQFSSLNVTTSTLEPERFTNRELGIKWDVTPALALTAAGFRLDRTNTSAHDPANPALTIQTGAQRTTGFELSAMGAVTSRWQIALAHSTLRARIVNATTAAPAGATTPLVPQHRVSAWNKYSFGGEWAAGLGVVHQSRTYAAIDNTVLLPAFTHIDGAVFIPSIRTVRPQLNVENLFNTRYYSTANGNNNISFGAPRTLRLSVTSRF